MIKLTDFGEERFDVRLVREINGDALDRTGQKLPRPIYAVLSTGRHNNGRPLSRSLPRNRETNSRGSSQNNNSFIGKIHIPLPFQYETSAIRIPLLHEVPARISFFT
jgi:hypothetical protein